MTVLQLNPILFPLFFSLFRSQTSNPPPYGCARRPCLSVSRFVSPDCASYSPLLLLLSLPLINRDTPCPFLVYLGQYYPPAQGRPPEFFATPFRLSNFQRSLSDLCYYLFIDIFYFSLVDPNTFYPACRWQLLRAPLSSQEAATPSPTLRLF